MYAANSTLVMGAYGEYRISQFVVNRSCYGHQLFNYIVYLVTLYHCPAYLLIRHYTYSLNTDANTKRKTFTLQQYRKSGKIRCWKFSSIKILMHLISVLINKNFLTEYLNYVLYRGHRFKFDNCKNSPIFPSQILFLYVTIHMVNMTYMRKKDQLNRH